MRLKPFPFRALIDRLAVSVHVLYAKLHGTPGRDCVGQLPGKPGDDLINGSETDVADLGKNLSAKVGTGIDHALGRKPEQLVGRLINPSRHSLLALRRGEKDKINHFGIQLPGRSEINLDVASRYRMPMRMIHTKRHLRNARSAVVLRHSSPSVTERVCAVPTLFRYPHALAELLYAIVHIRVERVRGREPLVKVQQVGVVSLGQIFLN